MLPYWLMHCTSPSPWVVPWVPSINIWMMLLCWDAVLAELPTKPTPPTDCIRPGLEGCVGSGLVDEQTLTQPEDFNECKQIQDHKKDSKT